MSRTRMFVAGAAVFTLLALLFSTQIVVDARYSGHPVGWKQALILAFAGWYGWALLTPLVVLVARREPFTRAGILAHTLCSIVFTLVKLGATMQLLEAAGFGRRESQWLMNLPLNIATYWAIAIVVRAVDAHLRTQELEASLSEARLMALQSQIRPHFLFNTLHSISELMHEDVDAADRMVARLSELLRASLDTGGRPLIPLREELGTLERYLDIERVRFGDRLQTRIDVEPAALDLLVPTFLLQPLVENSVRHAHGGMIEIRAAAKEMLEIVVRDDGVGFVQQKDGTGLPNVRQRVFLAGGHFDSWSDNGAVVEILLPRRTA